MKNIIGTESRNLSSISTSRELAVLLGLEERNLLYVTKHAPKLYRKLMLAKADGGLRTINVPEDSLKEIQRAILDRVLVRKSLQDCVYGFGKGRSIVDNARLHAHSDFVLTADIKDFFPSVHFTRVNRVFASLGLKESLAKKLTGMTTLNYGLPQGAPSSPYIASLALEEMDKRIRRLCVGNHLLYSRYFDDIVISGNARAHTIFETIEKIVRSEGYILHADPKKLRFYGPDDEKLITGILVRNGKLQAPSTQDVVDYVAELKTRGLLALKGENPAKERMSIRGKIAFLMQVDSSIGSLLGKEFESIAW
jgi:RNA-directed DNA polymerase